MERKLFTDQIEKEAQITKRCSSPDRSFRPRSGTRLGRDPRETNFGSSAEGSSSSSTPRVSPRHSVQDRLAVGTAAQPIDDSPHFARLALGREPWSELDRRLAGRSWLSASGRRRLRWPRPELRFPQCRDAGRHSPPAAARWPAQHSDLRRHRPLGAWRWRERRCIRRWPSQVSWRAGDGASRHLRARR